MAQSIRTGAQITHTRRDGVAVTVVFDGTTDDATVKRFQSDAKDVATVWSGGPRECIETLRKAGLPVVAVYQQTGPNVVIFAHLEGQA